jgi:hypothetical protein
MGDSLDFSQPSADLCLDPVRGHVRVLMLPQALDGPAGLAESSVVSPIAIDIGGELRQPILAVAVGHRAMLGARVPEAPVDENSELQPREHDVGPDPNLTSPDEEVLPEAKPAAM